MTAHAHRLGLTHTARSVREPATVCVSRRQVSGRSVGAMGLGSTVRPVR